MNGKAREVAELPYSALDPIFSSPTTKKKQAFKSEKCQKDQDWEILISSREMNGLRKIYLFF